MYWGGARWEGMDVAAASNGILKHVMEDGRNFLALVSKAHSSGSVWQV